MIFERKFNEKAGAKRNAGKKPPASAAHLLGNTRKNPWGDLDIKDRAKELLDKYRIIRSSDYSIAVKLKLNKEEEIEVIPEEPEEPVVDPKDVKKGKK